MVKNLGVRNRNAPAATRHRIWQALWSMLLVSTLVPAVLSAEVIPLCTEWTEAIEIGQLDPNQIPEASGLAISSAFPERFYHVDDSGTTIYITDSRGLLLQSVVVEGAPGFDVEDLALGPCGSATCLFIADIGDNAARRETIEIILVEERAGFSDRVVPERRIVVRYPNGPRDAEALGVASNGDIYLISRNFFPARAEAHADLYRLPAESWRGAGATVLPLAFVAPIDLGAIAPELPGRIVSGMDVSEDDQRFLILTYQGAFEFQMESLASPDLRTTGLVESIDFGSIGLTQLPQQEGIAYLPQDRGFVYTTEAIRGVARMMRVDCKSED